MQTQWFKDDAYLKVDGQPLLLTFGPQYFRSSSDWETLFSVLDTPPALVTLDKHMVLDALASFPWPPMFGFTVNQEGISGLSGRVLPESGALGLQRRPGLFRAFTTFTRRPESAPVTVIWMRSRGRRCGLRFSWRSSSSRMSSS